MKITLQLCHKNLALFQQRQKILRIALKFIMKVALIKIVLKQIMRQYFYRKKYPNQTVCFNGF